MEGNIKRINFLLKIALILISIFYPMFAYISPTRASVSGDYPVTNFKININSADIVANAGPPPTYYCDGVMSWSPPDFKKLLSETGYDINYPSRNYSFLGQITETVGADKKVLFNVDFNYSNSSFTFRYKTICGKTYNFAIYTYFQRGTANEKLAGSLYVSKKLESKSGQVGEQVKDGDCPVQNLQSYIVTNPDEKTGITKNSVVLKWRKAEDAKCTGKQSYTISPLGPEAAGMFENPSGSGNYMGYAGNWKTKQTFTVTTMIAGAKVGSKQVTVDPGENETEKENVNTETEKKDTTTASEAKSSTCEDACKNPWGIFSPTGEIREMICNIQCAILDWMGGLIGNMINKVLVQSIL